MNKIMNNIIYIGIDNGLSGAIAFLSGNETIAIDMPIITIKKGKKTKREYDLHTICKIIDNKTIEAGNNDTFVFATIEQAQAYPKQGGVSNYTTGYCFGLMNGLLVGMDIPLQTVHPRIWQKEFFKGQAGETKKLSYRVASALFPKVELMTPRGRKLDGRADALLLAEYGRRVHT